MCDKRKKTNTDFKKREATIGYLTDQISGCGF